VAIEPFTALSGNLSEAWAQVLLRLLAPGITALSPVVVAVTDFDDVGPVELPSIRALLDAALVEHNHREINTVANTVFPESLWRPGTPNNDTNLYARYDRIWPRIQRYAANRRGVYFRRLTSFRPSTHSTDEPVNQLARLIEIYKHTHRRSALQAGLFDPTSDHRNEPYLGFPCLQQLAFVPLDDDALAITAFYAMQLQFEKAYGNYLGLCRLGRFVAAQLDRRLVRMTCTASVVTNGDATKSGLAGLGQQLRAILAERGEERRTA
jgi:hypothetical protein